MKADYETRCPACDEKIYEGDEIAATDDDEWCHVDCVEEN